MRSWLVLLSVLLGSGLWAVPLATLSSLEGDVSVVREGKLLPSEKIPEGFTLEPFDTVILGATGRADLRLLAASGVTGTLRLDSATVLYLELSSAKKEQVIGVEMLQGGVSVKIQSLVGTSQVELRTEAARFTLGQGSARLVFSPGGDQLLTVSDGRVSCRVDNRTLYAEPGNAIEVQSLDQVAQSTPANAATLSALEASWLAQKNLNLRQQAPAYFRLLVSRYQRQLGLFQRAWERVQKESHDDTGTTQAAVSSLRLAGASLERSLGPILALRRLYDEGVLSPSAEVTRGFLAKDFFRQAQLELPAWSSRLAEARGLYKAVAERNKGEFPRATQVVGISWDSPYFR